MPRKNKSKQTVKDAETAISTAITEALPETAVEPQPDAPVVPVTVADKTPSESPHTFVERHGHRKVPDPFQIAFDRAAGVFLYEDKQDRELAIIFDEWPGDRIADLMEQAGYSWDSRQAVWVKLLDESSARSTRIETERLYHQVCQMIRQKRGVEAEPDITS